MYRAAKVKDIKQIQIVRNSVKENTLSNPVLVSDKDCEEFITTRGKGWVCEIDETIVGFGIVDLKENNIWALFVKPEFESQGIAKELYTHMMDWYFDQTKNPIWLGTLPNTKAEKFYEKLGWIKSGSVNKGEIKYEMTYKSWIQNG